MIEGNEKLSMGIIDLYDMDCLKTIVGRITRSTDPLVVSDYFVKVNPDYSEKLVLYLSECLKIRKKEEE